MIVIPLRSVSTGRTLYVCTHRRRVAGGYTTRFGDIRAFRQQQQRLRLHFLGVGSHCPALDAPCRLERGPGSGFSFYRPQQQQQRGVKDKTIASHPDTHIRFGSIRAVTVAVQIQCVLLDFILEVVLYKNQQRRREPEASERAQRSSARNRCGRKARNARRERTRGGGVAWPPPAR